MESSIHQELMQKYSQEVLDPQSLQEGQSVYDATGQEMIVLENPKDTTTKVLMPADQQDAALPEGVNEVDDSELAGGYSVQDPGEGTTGPVVASMSVFEDYIKGG